MGKKHYRVMQTDPLFRSKICELRLELLLKAAACPVQKKASSLKRWVEEAAGIWASLSAVANLDLSS